MTPHQDGVIWDLWEIATGVWAPRLGRLRRCNNGSWPVVAAYHKARTAILAAPEGQAGWIADQAVREFARIVRAAENVGSQLTLFDLARAA